LIESEIRAIICHMVTLAEIETWVFKLPEADRARLAADLLDSLPGVLVEDDEGLAEALRRSEEMDRDPSVCLTHEEFLKAVGPIDH
jgi:putative addiction module component (TIGR02574 family)